MIKIWDGKKQEQDIHLALVKVDDDIYLAVVDPVTGNRVTGGNLLRFDLDNSKISRCTNVDFPNNPFKLDSEGRVIIE